MPTILHDLQEVNHTGASCFSCSLSLLLLLLLLLLLQRLLAVEGAGGAGGGEECQAEYLGDAAQSQRENSADRFLGIGLR